MDPMGNKKVSLLGAGAKAAPVASQLRNPLKTCPGIPKSSRFLKGSSFQNVVARGMRLQKTKRKMRRSYQRVG